MKTVAQYSLLLKIKITSHFKKLHHMRMYKLLIFNLLFAISMNVFAQMDTYNYKQKLNGISESWHKIRLPNEIFHHISGQTSDLRIYGITEKDTVEAPYLLHLTQDEISYEEADFEIINESKTSEGYFFTLKVPKPTTLNQLELDFELANFDWKIRLEGAKNESEWVTILENYRILSIQNVETSYSFTRLSFPASTYRYFRVFVPSVEPPRLKSAKLVLRKVVKGNFQEYRIKNQTISENKTKKQTEIILELEKLVAVSQLKIEVKNTFDYYRPIQIQGLTDSVKTEKGWVENYRHLTSGVLNSIEENHFKFESQAVKKFKISIQNADNEPLQVADIQVKGYFYDLLVRFTESATYYLVYGKKDDRFPQYDIERFRANIPENVSVLTLEKAEKIPKIESPKVTPLFENEFWLWAVMFLIIIVLGGFTIKMIKK